MGCIEADVELPVEAVSRLSQWHKSIGVERPGRCIGGGRRVRGFGIRATRAERFRWRTYDPAQSVLVKPRQRGAVNDKSY